MCRLNVGGVRSGSERTKAGRRDTPRKRSERIKVILSKRDVSCFCRTSTKSLQGKTKIQRMCHRASQDLPLDRASEETSAPPYLVFASLARRSVDCCADVAPLSCLRDCRLRPLTPPTPAKEGVICCCITMGTKAGFNHAGQDEAVK